MQVNYSCLFLPLQLTAFVAVFFFQPGGSVGETSQPIISLDSEPDVVTASVLPGRGESAGPVFPI